MKKLIPFILLISLVQICRAQSEAILFKNKELNNNLLNNKELKQQFTGINFSKLWTQSQNEFVYGFIGDDFQRIRIKFITVTKASSTNTYSVYGKSMVKTNICGFRGTIVITNIRKFNSASAGTDEVYKNKGIKGQFTILGNYTFAEAKGQSHAGVFKGSFKSDFYLDKNNKVHYDDIDKQADGFTNNQFVGSWNQYNSNLTQRCNWGDYRIPNSGDLDIGAGGFSPTDKYLKMGWQNLHDALGDHNQAKKDEQATWWK